MKQVLETAGEIYSGFETFKQWVGAIVLVGFGVFTLFYPLESAPGFTDEVPAWVGKVITYGTLSLGSLMLLALMMPEAIAYRARSLMLFAIVVGILVFAGFRLEPMLREIHDLRDRGVEAVAVRVEPRAKVWPRKEKSSSSILLRYEGRTKRMNVGVDVPVGGSIPVLVDPGDRSRVTPGKRGQGWLDLLRLRLGVGWAVGGALLILFGALAAFYLLANFFSGPPKPSTVTNA